MARAVPPLGVAAPSRLPPASRLCLCLLLCCVVDVGEWGAAGAEAATFDAAAPPALREFNAAAVTASRLPAYVLVDPEACASGVCADFRQFWAVAAAAYPEAMWRLARADCGALCVLAPKADEPGVVVWDGRRFAAYAGARSLAALAQDIHAAHARAADQAPREADGARAAETNVACAAAFLAPGHGRAGWGAPVVAAAPLRPADVRGAEVYSDFGPARWAADGAFRISPGRVTHSSINQTSHFDVLRAVVSRDEVQRVLALVQDPTVDFDGDPDSVDGMPSHEIFVFNDDIRALEAEHTCAAGDGTCAAPPPLADARVDTLFKLDKSAAHFAARAPLRARLRAVMDPIVAARVTPFVNARYAAACRGACTPCYSLVRRYLPGERRSHEPHHDEHALVTVVVSLADSGAEYAGGLYVVGGEGERLYLGLDRGDAAVHASELHHGVHVLSGTRWSWILWYRDSETCDDLSATWFEACAHDGNPICEALHASKAASPRDPGAHLRWHERAAGHGLAGSMLKLGRASLKRLPSTLAYDAGVAAAWFRRGVEQADPECAFALAQMLVANETAAARGGSYATRLAEAVSLLEEAAAKGHTFAAYNLGVAHLFGFAEMDAELAAGWFTASGLPEGLHLASLYHAARGNADEAERTMDMAVKVGHHAPWCEAASAAVHVLPECESPRRRDAARERTGSGGSGGVSLYSSWPDACATEAVRHVPQKASEGPT